MSRHDNPTPSTEQPNRYRRTTRSVGCAQRSIRIEPGRTPSRSPTCNDPAGEQARHIAHEQFAVSERQLKTRNQIRKVNRCRRRSWRKRPSWVDRSERCHAWTETLSIWLGVNMHVNILTEVLSGQRKFLPVEQFASRQNYNNGNREPQLNDHRHL